MVPSDAQQHSKALPVKLVDSTYITILIICIKCLKVQPVIRLWSIRSVLLRMQTKETNVFAVDFLKRKDSFRRVRKAGRSVGKSVPHVRLHFRGPGSARQGTNGDLDVGSAVLRQERVDMVLQVGAELRLYKLCTSTSATDTSSTTSNNKHTNYTASQ